MNDYLAYIFIGVIAITTAIRLLPFVRARRMQGVPAPDLGGVITERQRSHQSLLVYFWSPSCMMCRSMTPVVEELARTRSDVISVNAAEHMDVARRFRIMGTPTLVLLKDGKVERVLVGAKSEKQIRALLG
jgi:thioredoxin 1